MVGRLQVAPAAVEENESKEEEQQPTAPAFVCSIQLGKLPASVQALSIGQLVVGKVVRISPQNAIVEIAVAERVGALSAMPPHEGAIRMEDIRAGASEQLVISDCFQPGDLVICRVISLGDSRRYFLSTAETELGVIRALSRNGNGIPMMPISWKEMECPETGVKEPRKCAKPAALK
jgi:exosome complex component CSL4